jgi:hypothetical protein
MRNLKIEAAEKATALMQDQHMGYQSTEVDGDSDSWHFYSEHRCIFSPCLSPILTNVTSDSVYGLAY